MKNNIKLLSGDHASIAIGAMAVECGLERLHIDMLAYNSTGTKAVMLMDNTDQGSDNHSFACIGAEKIGEDCWVATYVETIDGTGDMIGCLSVANSWLEE